MTSESLADLEEKNPQALSLILDEIRNLQGQVKNISEKQTELEEKIDNIGKIQKGGNQPSRKIPVKNNDGQPACDAVFKIMRSAREGGKFDGVTVSEVEIILEEHDKERTRKPTLNLMRKIARKFGSYEFKSGNSSQPSTLYYRGSEVK